jgi:hypothetical protein
VNNLIQWITQRYIGDRYDVELCVQVNQLFPGHIVKLSHHVRKYILLRPLFYINITRYTMDADSKMIDLLLDRKCKESWELSTGQNCIQWIASQPLSAFEQPIVSNFLSKSKSIILLSLR